MLLVEDVEEQKLSSMRGSTSLAAMSSTERCLRTRGARLETSKVSHDTKASMIQRRACKYDDDNGEDRGRE